MYQVEQVKTGRYRHYRGGEYLVIGVARHSEAAEEFVVYRALYGDERLWIRPMEMFLETVNTDGGRSHVSSMWTNSSSGERPHRRVCNIGQYETCG